VKFRFQYRISYPKVRLSAAESLYIVSRVTLGKMFIISAFMIDQMVVDGITARRNTEKKI
jgi:hypothetical protein